LSGLTSGSSGLVCEYRRQGQNAWTAVTLSAGTLGTWSSGGFVADGALAGAYELGVPDAALAAGARWAAIRLRGAANMLACLIEIELDLVNYQDSVRFGLTALPNATVSGVGGLLTAPTTANTGLANATQLAGQTVTAAAGVTFPTSVGTSTFAGGAVASVTGNVGGNVTGSVGSIATGGIAATSFAAGAIDAGAIATDAIGANEISAAAVTKIQTGLATPTNITAATGVVLSSAAVDAIWAKTLTALTGVPTITSDVLNAVNWIFTLARDKVTQTATTQTVFRDDGTTTLATATVSDDGTVFTRGKFA